MTRRRDVPWLPSGPDGWPPEEPLFASVVVAESKAVVLTGMRALIESTDEFDLVGTASSLRDLRGLLRSRKTDVVVVGLRVLGDAGKDLRALRRLAGTHAVVAVADALSPAEVLGVLEAGVRAVMLTETTGDCLRASIRAAARGQLFVDPLLMPVLVDAAFKGTGGIAGPLGLTVQERRVVSYLPAGLTNAEIGRELGLSPETVKSHLRRAMAKLGARDRAEAGRIFEAERDRHANG